MRQLLKCPGNIGVMITGLHVGDSHTFYSLKVYIRSNFVGQRAPHQDYGHVFQVSISEPSSTIGQETGRSPRIQPV